jgi:methionyl-tRNA formyltransferase
MAGRMRLVLFGDGAWAANSLRRLNEAGYTLLAIVQRARPSSQVLEETARELGLPLLQPARAGDPQFIAALASLDPDLYLSISYNQILRPALLATARLGAVNFHAGKLPYYRGRNVINWAIINGETELGITSHFVDEGIDTGDIILQRTLQIAWTDTYGAVLDRVVAMLPDLAVDTVALLESGKATRRPQSYLAGTYCPGREDGDEWLDWSDTSFNLHNKVRGITRPGPGAHTLLGDDEVIVWRAFYDRAWPRYLATPGLVVGRLPEGNLVKTGDSTLLVQEVQREGGPCEAPNWPVGTRLGVNLWARVRALEERVKELERGRMNQGNRNGPR